MRKLGDGIVIHDFEYMSTKVPFNTRLDEVVLPTLYNVDKTDNKDGVWNVKYSCVFKKFSQVQQKVINITYKADIANIKLNVTDLSFYNSVIVRDTNGNIASLQLPNIVKIQSPCQYQSHPIDKSLDANERYGKLVNDEKFVLFLLYAPFNSQYPTHAKIGGPKSPTDNTYTIGYVKIDSLNMDNGIPLKTDIQDENNLFNILEQFKIAQALSQEEYKKRTQALSQKIAEAQRKIAEKRAQKPASPLSVMAKKLREQFKELSEWLE